MNGHDRGVRERVSQCHQVLSQGSGPAESDRPKYGLRKLPQNVAPRSMDNGPATQERNCQHPDLKIMSLCYP
jgi:hypothetical protein